MLYDNEFYSRHGDQSLESARIIVPLVMRLAPIRCVVDVGCGIGGWLRAFIENGVTVVRGIDGEYVDDSQLLIARECFRSVDLTQPLKVEERYDLAVCLEVAEHLNATSGRRLVSALTELAPLILFSAAVPGQGGIGHVNEQWPDYWRRLFMMRGFKMLDPIRPFVRDDQRIEWWYRQNIVMFACEAAMSVNPLLRETSDGGRGLEWVHIDMLYAPHAGVRNLLVHLKPALARAIRRGLRLRSDTMIT